MARQSEPIKAIVTALNGFIEGAVKKVVLDTVANLVSTPQDGGTPVDTGWARSNWVPRIGKPATTPAGSPESVTLSAQETGKATVLSFKLGAGKVYITNNVPYIVKLNEGSSKQAPAGFVQRAIHKAVEVQLPAGFTGI